MIIKVLKSGSRGNCSILKDSSGSQIILDCGIKADDILVEIDWDNPIAILLSHKHSDHYNPQTIERLYLYGAKVFDENVFSDNRTIKHSNWIIVPISLPHSNDTNSWAFLIYNTLERKHIFFATDCTKLPKIANKAFDLIMVENNYSESRVLENFYGGTVSNFGYKNHLSSEYVLDWFSHRSRCANILITHLSNSNNIALDGLAESYKNFADNVYIATKKISFSF